jgi:hypothetical protein
MKLYARNNGIKTKLKNGKSFEQWCIENNRQDILLLWDYKLNDCKPNEICYSSYYKKYYFKCPQNLHKSETQGIAHFTSGQTGSISCKACNSFAQWGIDNLGEDFLDKYWNYEINTISPWNITYASKQKIYIKCQEKNYHGSYQVIANDFTTGGNRCSYCSVQKVHILDSLGTLYPEVLEIWSDKNKKSPYEYKPYSMSKIWWKCLKEKHENYYRSINKSTLSNFRCSKCVREQTESILQKNVRLYLNKIGYIVLHEQNCNIIAQNPKYNGSQGQMPYDNEIKELNLIIEVMGKQHAIVTGFHYLQARYNNTTPEYELHMQQVRDRYKRIFAKSRGYSYLEIPYWTDDAQETWKQLIDDKISEIKNNLQI